MFTAYKDESLYEGTQTTQLPYNPGFKNSFLPFSSLVQAPFRVTTTLPVVKDTWMWAVLRIPVC